jgi:hypothetical protein
MWYNVSPDWRSLKSMFKGTSGHYLKINKIFLAYTIVYAYYCGVQMNAPKKLAKNGS